MHLSSHFLSTAYQVFLLFLSFIGVYTVRGFGRALGITLAGDASAREDGYLTVYPLAHVDIACLIVCTAFILGIEAFVYQVRLSELLLLFLLFGFRCSYSSVYSPNAARHFKWGILLVVLLPFFLHLLTTFVAALGIFLATKYQQVWGYPIMRTLVDIGDSFINLSLVVGVIELLPLPPFQGSYLLYLFSQKAEEWLAFLEENAFLLLLLILVVPFVSEFFLIPLFTTCDFLKEGIFRLVGRLI